MMRTPGKVYNKCRFGMIMSLLLPLYGYAAEPEETSKIQNEWFSLQVLSRAPEQMSAFYEGRGFDARARQEIRNRCFVTVLMRNTGTQVVWLDLSQWRFHTEFDPIPRITRAAWRATWQEIKLPLAHQATFGWTLLPEQRNLLPNESVGGNITLPEVEQPFTVEAIFALGQNRDAGQVTVKFENVQCKK